jgi:subtilisin-like proprotein convertase family protein
MDALMLDLPDRDAARSRAELIVRELMSVTDHKDTRAWAEWRLEVRDGSGASVAAVRFLT